MSGINYRTCFLVILVAVIAIFGPICDSRAGLIVSIPNASISAGGTGTVDVMVSDDGLGTADVLAFNYHFQITPVGAVDSSLEFTDPQDNAFTADAAYIFSGDSFLPATTSVAPPGADYVNGDTAVLGIPTTVGGPFLLTRLSLTSIPIVLNATPGDQFKLELIPDTGALLDTFFSTDGISNDIPYTANFGTITITAAAQAVPEPSSLAMLLISAGGALGWRFRRKK